MHLQLIDLCSMEFFGVDMYLSFCHLYVQDVYVNSNNAEPDFNLFSEFVSPTFVLFF